MQVADGRPELDSTETRAEREKVADGQRQKGKNGRDRVRRQGPDRKKMFRERRRGRVDWRRAASSILVYVSSTVIPAEHETCEVLGMLDALELDEMGRGVLRAGYAYCFVSR
ncbi:hypothetical protein RRF57_005277 [Xylaria bambusicola]|uniref:Uncharacterized protein n=1 Tax=Xylaria bambusicola TaxID=326684 RepID=A0AAN7UJK7_9PEZI